MTKLPKNLNTILHIGAGQGEDLPAYLESDAKRILLVEPNPSLAEQLRRRTQNDERVQVLELAITDDPALNQLNEYNLPEAASLYRPTGLRQIFPGLRITVQHPVTTQTPEQLLKQYPLEGDHNLLVIQAPGAEPAIVKALASANKLGTISNIRLTLPAEVYYEGSDRPEDALQTLAQRGYNTEHTNTQNPDWPEYHLVCNPLARRLQDVDLEKHSLTQALQKSENAQQQTQVALDAATRELGELTQKLDAHKKQVETLQAEREQTNAKSAELAEQLKNAQQKLEASDSARQKAEAKQQEADKRAEKLASQVKKLEEQLAAANKNQQQFTELQKRMEHLFDQQGLQLEQAANALGRHVTSTAQNTAKELEAGFQLQQQLGTDFASLAERGNRLPSTVALQLSRQLKAQPYDLVIEMGSGVTTSFLAHTLRKRAENQGDDESESTSVARYVDPSDDDLPKRILCFEHNRSTVNSLQNTLKQSGLAPIITLQYAPLVACQHQGKEYLYYDCGSRLRQIAQLFENRTARVFILLNDVADDSRPDLIAALPQLLQYLSAHSLDIVVNTAQADANITNHWHQLLDARGLDYQPATEFGHQAVQLLKVNP